jgi:hypothetical protein
MEESEEHRHHLTAFGAKTGDARHCIVGKPGRGDYALCDGARMSISRRSFLAGSAAAALAPTPAHAAPSWIDVHLHLVGGAQKQFDRAAETALAGMESAGIQKAVVFPPPFAASKFAFDYTDYVPHLRRHAGRFGFLAGGGILNPLLHEFREPASVTPGVKSRFTDLAKRMLDAGAVGFGEIAVLHFSLVPNHPFEEVVSTHPLLFALVEVAAANDAVIDLHMDPIVGTSMTLPAGLKSPPNPRTLQGNVAGLETLLAHDRKARIAWAHGGSDFTGNMTPALVGGLMDRHPNLFMSLRPIPLKMLKSNPFGLQIKNSLLTPRGIDPAWLKLLQRHSDRFVMGADAFFLSPTVPSDSPLTHLGSGNDGRIGAASRALSAMPPALARKIGTENAVRLYRL